MSDATARDHAVVLGAGMAGLLAARVLSDHFRRVTVVDRDELPTRPDHRVGVPQSQHAHTLLWRGAQILEQLLPGLMATLVEEGASTVDAGTTLRTVTPAGPLPIAPGGAPMVGVSRPLLEWHVRERIAALANVTIRTRLDVDGLTSRDGAVVGADVRSRDTGEVEALAADLVVDATGRGSRAPRWLADLGCGEVPEEVIEIGVGYASQWFQRPEGWAEPWDSAVIHVQPPDNPRAGLALAVEGGRWTVTLAGVAGNVPPLDDAGFLAFAHQLGDPCIARAIEASVPLGPARAGHIPTSRLRRFERMRHWPRGLLVTGDAVCAFNPMYGQGMTVAARDALVLDAALHDRRPDLERRFRRALARNLSGVWAIAGEDLRWDVVGSSGVARRRVAAVVSAYVERVLRRAVVDPVVAAAWLNVIGLVHEPSALMTPAMALRVFGLRRPGPRRPLGATARRVLGSAGAAVVSVSESTSRRPPPTSVGDAARTRDGLGR